MYLYQAIQEVLRLSGSVSMSPRDIANEINSRGLYTKRDGQQVDSRDVILSAWDYSARADLPLFDVLIRNH